VARQPKVEVALLADAGAMVRGFRQGRDAAGEFEGGLAKAQKAVGVMDKAVIGAAAALGGAFVVALKTGISSLMEHEKADAQTAAAIKSTGGAAKVSAGQISSMADAIEKKTGIDDVAIKQGSNLLLTFTKIRNEAGQGNDIFNQTTKIMADMSTAMGKDPTSSAMMLGKALNDPVKGVSALGRAGVQFSKEQKDLIKDMVESGNVMGAQKMILKELETQFGGSAEAAGKTFGGRLNILKARLEEVAESVAARLMPVLMAIMDWAERNWPQIEKALQSMFDVLMSVGQAIWNVAYPAVRAIFRFLNENRPVAVALVAVLASLYVGFKLLMIARAVAGAVQLLNLAFLANPVVAVVAGVVALGAALVIAYKKSETFRGIVNRVGEVLKTFLLPIFNAVKSAIEAIGALLRGDLGGFISKIGEMLKNLLEAGLKGVLALPMWLATEAVNFGKDIIAKIAEGAKDIAAKVWDAIKNLATDLAGSVVGWASGLLNIGKTVVSGIVSGVSGLAQAIWDKIGQMPRALIGLVAGWFSGLVDIGGKVIDFVVSGISGLAQAVWNKIIGFPAALGRLVVGWFTGDEGLPTIGGRVIGWIASGITGLAAAAWDNIKGFPGALLNKLGDWAQALKDIGVKILEGIAAGITGAPGALIAAVGRALGIDTQGPPANVPAVLDPVANWTARRDRAFDDLAADFKRPGSQGGTKITPAEQALLKRRQQAWLRDNPRPAAIGGIFTGPVNSLVGEAGDEAVIPLERPSGRQALADALELAGGGGRSMVVNLTFNGVLDAREAARVIQPELNRLVSVSY
jgi:hypothetical protein